MSGVYVGYCDLSSVYSITNPKRNYMYQVLGHNQCNYCKRAIEVLAKAGKSFTYLDARESINQQLVSSLRSSGVSSVPQIWVGNDLIGGYSDLVDYLAKEQSNAV